MDTYLGQQHKELIDWLKTEWLSNGPPVCFIEGFPGVGKEQVARGFLADLVDTTVVMVDMPETEAGLVDDLMLDLATELSIAGRSEMAEAIDAGENLSIAFQRVFAGQVVIVITGFQRAFSSKPMLGLLRRIAGRVGQPGRLLLLTEEMVDSAFESAVENTRHLDAFTQEEAEEFLCLLLKDKNREDEIPLDRRRDIVNWLGGNPRAIQILVSALVTEPLNDLVGELPETWELRDRDISPALLRDLEKKLLEKVISGLSPEAAVLLEQLSVHRKPVKREALESLIPDAEKRTACRDELINRLLLEHHVGWYRMDSLVRDITRSKPAEAQLRKYHSRAADYYTRPFKAKNILNPGKLGGQFVEARHHLVLADRESDLDSIARLFGSHILDTMGPVSPVPRSGEELDERIAVLSAFLGDGGPKGLEFYLARLLKARGRSKDLARALTHARRACGPQAPADSWVLRIGLENQIEGIEAAVAAAREALDLLPVEKGLFAVYQLWGELLAGDGQRKEAVYLLKEGIQRIEPQYGLFSIYQSCAEILTGLERADEAVDLLKEGMGRIEPQYNLFSLYESCAEILADLGRADEAVDLLKEGIKRIDPQYNLFCLYQSCAEILADLGRADEAVDLLKEGIGRIGPEYCLFVLYETAASVLSRSGKVAEAVAFLLEGARSLPPGKWGRYKLLEEALCVSVASGEAKHVRDVMDESQGAEHQGELRLGEALLQAMRGDWNEAAAAAHSGRLQNPRYFALAAQEAFSLLCAGNADAAYQALQDFPLPLKLDTPATSWVYTFIALRRGDVAGARAGLEALVGHPLGLGEEPTEELLLHIWDNLDYLGNQRVSFHFPILPPSLTGLGHTVTRLPYGPPVLPAARPADSAKQSPKPADTDALGLEAQSLIDELGAIPPGEGAAYDYQGFVLRAVDFIFAPNLCDTKPEEWINDGRKRVDIVSRNGAEQGFFKELSDRYDVHCPFVFFECKNYSRDLGNPEVDQLAMRLTDKRGKFGALVCRSLEDEGLMLRRCKDALDDGRKHMIVLTDSDMKTLIGFRAKSDDEAIDNHLHAKLRELIM